METQESEPGKPDFMGKAGGLTPRRPTSEIFFVAKEFPVHPGHRSAFRKIHTTLSTVGICGTAPMHTSLDVLLGSHLRAKPTVESVSHCIVVADSNDCVSVFGAHLLTSALDAAGVSSLWSIASAVPPHRLRSADVSSLPKHVRSIAPRVEVADPDHLATADLIVGFADMRWPVVDHVRALHCPAPALVLSEFIDDAEVLAPKELPFAALTDGAMRYALGRQPSRLDHVGHRPTDDGFWTELADVCARFANVLQRVID